MGHGRRKTKNDFDGYYHCSKNGQGLHQCSVHYIRDDVLRAYVLSRLQYWSQQPRQSEEKLRTRLMGATDQERSASNKKQAAELRKSEIGSLFMLVYVDGAKVQSERQALDTAIQSPLDGQIPSPML